MYIYACIHALYTYQQVRYHTIHTHNFIRSRLTESLQPQILTSYRGIFDQKHVRIFTTCDKLMNRYVYVSLHAFVLYRYTYIYTPIYIYIYIHTHIHTYVCYTERTHTYVYSKHMYVHHCIAIQYTNSPQ
jgi:hypothetical protein